jgi:CheY-like chemotaxis protein
MASEFETMFITAGDKPALVGCSNTERVDAARRTLRDLGYKIHAVTSHADFIARFSRIRYEVVILEEMFAAEKVEDNLSLLALQKMAMNMRRHAVIILVGDNFKTYDAMQAFQKSVHVVINVADISMLKHLTEKTLAENEIFLHAYREVQSHMARL